MMKDKALRQSSVATTKWLNIEFSSKCNLRCRWCALDHAKPAVFITKEILGKVLDEIAGSGHFALDQIDLHNGGETLLHPRLGDLLALLAGKKKKAFGSFPQVNLLTNAALLTEEVAKTVIASGAVDLVRFSVDGGTKADYENIRRGARWDAVQGNIKRFLSLNEGSGGRVRTGIICVIPLDKKPSVEWMEGEFRDLLLSVDGYELRYPINWDGSRDLGLDVKWKDEIREGERDVCLFLLRDLVVLPNGDVTVCCADLNSRGVIGNIERSSLFELYNSAARADMIDKFHSGQKNRIPLCSHCQGFKPEEMDRGWSFFFTNEKNVNAE